MVEPHQTLDMFVYLNMQVVIGPKYPLILMVKPLGTTQEWQSRYLVMAKQSLSVHMIMMVMVTNLVMPVYMVKSLRIHQQW